MSTSIEAALPMADYLAHPALSSHGARLLLPPNTPAHFRYAQLHPDTPSKAMDYGTVAHSLVLGRGGEDIMRVRADNWMTKAAKEAKADAHGAGMTPVLNKDYLQALEMAKALRAHPTASALLEPGSGTPEVSLFWNDPRFAVDGGLPRKCRLDWMPDITGSLIVADYKTAASADDESFGKSAAGYGYHQQAAWNLDMVRAVYDVEEVYFVFIVQEKDPPFLVNVVELHPRWMDVGRAKNAEAMAIFAECLGNDAWPGYGGEIHLVELPPWADRAYRD